MMFVRRHDMCLDEFSMNRVEKHLEGGEIGGRSGCDWEWSDGHLSRDNIHGPVPFWQGRAAFRKGRNEVVLSCDRVITERNR
jgi:hypothetical protein